MNRIITLNNGAGLLLGLLFLGMASSVWAQQPQDNWYQEQIWTMTGEGLVATNGGLSAPYGVAIGKDGRIYVADDGLNLVQVYLPDGTYSFSITNNFGDGQSFSQPRGMITDDIGNLYVADYARDAVFVFTADGEYIRTIGGIEGNSNGELNGVIDVGVAHNGDIFILEYANHRVSIFDSDGIFTRSWGEYGTLEGQLYYPVSLAISPEGDVSVAAGNIPWNVDSLAGIKHFDSNGVFIKKFSSAWVLDRSGLRLGYAPQSIRFDPSGLLHAIVTWYVTYSGDTRTMPVYHYVYRTDGTLVRTYSNQSFPGKHDEYRFTWPCHAVGRDGTMILCSLKSKQLSISRCVLRDQYALPRNAIPQPATLSITQRENSSLVDIDYRVTDMDDATTHTGLLIFTNTSAAAELENCIPQPTLAENTSTNLGSGIAANTTHRLTWNPGADWSVNLGDFRVAIMAKDSRQNLLDIHYLVLPAVHGMPELKVSRSPLNDDDFMQVWWWLLATNDPGISMASNHVHGVSGAYTSQLLCDDRISTVDGRAYIYEKMNIREATPEELAWAKQGNMPSGSSPNQWTPGRIVAGRPLKVNEWGFDTGNWDTNSCKWVVPLN